jgi:hypothetical protein
MTHDQYLYRQLFENTITLASEKTRWRFGKYAAIAFLRGAAKDEKFIDFARGRVNLDFSLADTVGLLFDLVIEFYSDRLPFKGKFLRLFKDAVLEYLDDLLVPRGLVFQH